MFERILKVMRDNIRSRNYVMTLHAEEEMNNDDLTIFDVEHGILTGKVVERQKDNITAGWKCRIKGKTIGGDDIEVIAKISVTGRLVIITVYLP